MEQMPLPDKEQLLGKAVIYELKLLSHIPYGVDIYLETNYYWLLATVEKKKKITLRVVKKKEKEKNKKSLNFLPTNPVK